VHTAIVNYGLIPDKTALEDSPESPLLELGPLQHQGEIVDIARQVFATMFMMMGLRSLFGEAKNNENKMIVISVASIDDNPDSPLKAEFYFHFKQCNDSAGGFPMYVGTTNPQ